MSMRRCDGSTLLVQSPFSLVVMVLINIQNIHHCLGPNDSNKLRNAE